MVAWKKRTPVLKHVSQPALRDQGQDLIFGDVGETKPIHRRLKSDCRVVDGQLLLDPHIQRPAVLLELPGVEATRAGDPIESPLGFEIH